MRGGPAEPEVDVGEVTEEHFPDDVCAMAVPSALGRCTGPKVLLRPPGQHQRAGEVEESRRHQHRVVPHPLHHGAPERH